MLLRIPVLGNDGMCLIPLGLLRRCRGFSLAMGGCLLWGPNGSESELVEDLVEDVCVLVEDVCVFGC
jgi:hypothetical protein